MSEINIAVKELTKALGLTDVTFSDGDVWGKGPDALEVYTFSSKATLKIGSIEIDSCRVRGSIILGRWSKLVTEIHINDLSLYPADVSVRPEILESVVREANRNIVKQFGYGDTPQT